MHDDLGRIFSATGPFDALLPRWQPREGQLRMARAVTELALARRHGTASRPFGALTQREFDILDLVAQGPGDDVAHPG